MNSVGTASDHQHVNGKSDGDFRQSESDELLVS